MNHRIHSLTPQKWFFAAGLALGLIAFAVRAQDADSVLRTNDVIETQPSPEEESNGRDLEATNDVVSLTNTPGVQGATSAPAGSERSRWLERQRQNRTRQPALPPLAQTATSSSSASPLDFSAFKLITERNIFDPNRMPHTASTAQPKAVDAFSLVGTMSYAKGDFAFFDGTSSDYKKVLRPSESIAGYTVLAVEPDSVKLTRDNKQLELPIGSQLRRQEDGTWLESATTGSYASATSSAASNSQSSAATSGSESDIIKKLMERRKEE